MGKEKGGYTGLRAYGEAKLVSFLSGVSYMGRERASHKTAHTHLRHIQPERMEPALAEARADLPLFSNRVKITKKPNIAMVLVSVLCSFQSVV